MAAEEQSTRYATNELPPLAVELAKADVQAGLYLDDRELDDDDDDDDDE